MTARAPAAQTNSTENDLSVLPRNWYGADADTIAAHITSRINAAELQLEPYPYLIVPDLMPADFYRTAQKFCAAETAYAFPIPNGNGEARFPATRSFKNSPQLSDEAIHFWNFFRDTVCAAVNRATNAKMKAEIDSYFQWLRRRGFVEQGVAAPRLENSALQVFERTDSSVGAHHHSLYEIVTNLIYMPADNSLADTGTWIDRMTGWMDVLFGRAVGLSWRRPYFFKDDAARLMTYNIVPRFLESGEVQAPFMPNTLLSILNTPWSLHSQRTHHSQKRHLLLFASLLAKEQWAEKYRDTRKAGFELYPDELI